MRIRALNDRGVPLVAMIGEALETCEEIAERQDAPGEIHLTVQQPDRIYAEEERSRAPTVFSVLRAITAFFHTKRFRSRPLWRLWL